MGEVRIVGAEKKFVKVIGGATLTKKKLLKPVVLGFGFVVVVVVPKEIIS